MAEPFPPDQIRAIDRAADQVRAEHHSDQLDWAPLEAALPADELGGFMFMGYATRTGQPASPDTPGAIRLYKHGITRRYLNLDPEGHAYTYNSSVGYLPTPLADAVAHVHADLEALGATPTTRYDDAYRAQRNAALRAAGFDVLEA